MMIHNELDQVKNLIILGKQNEAINHLSSILKDTGDNISLQRVDLVKARIGNLKRDFTKGLISHENKSIEENKINFELLDIINKVQNLYRKGFNWKELFTFFTSVGSSIVLIFTILFLFETFYKQDFNTFTILVIVSIIIIAITLIFQFVNGKIDVLYKRLRETILLLSILYFFLPKIKEIVNDLGNDIFKVQSTYLLAVL